MTIWILIGIVLYTCIGSAMGGFYAAEDQAHFSKCFLICVTAALFWFPILLIIWTTGFIKFVVWMRWLKFKSKMRKWKIAIKKKILGKKYEEFDEDIFDENEMNDRYLRMGLASRTDVWDSKLPTAWETDE